MTNQTKKKRARQVLALGIAVGVTAGIASMAGCELAVDFDRTKIDAGAIDASFGDGGITPTDSGSADADAATDGGTDAPSNDASDAGDDAADADAAI